MTGTVIFNCESEGCSAVAGVTRDTTEKRRCHLQRKVARRCCARASMVNVRFDGHGAGARLALLRACEGSCGTPSCLKTKLVETTSGWGLEPPQAWKLDLGSAPVRATTTYATSPRRQKLLRWPFFWLQASSFPETILNLLSPFCPDTMPGPGEGFEYPPVEVSWLKRDVLLFAHSIGCTTEELHFLYVRFFAVPQPFGGQG